MEARDEGLEAVRVVADLQLHELRTGLDLLADALHAVLERGSAWVLDGTDEVVRCGVFWWCASSFLGSSLEDLEELLEVLVQLKDGSNIAASVAVVWRRKDCDDLFLMGPVVAL